MMKYCPNCSNEAKEVKLVQEEIVIGDRVVGYTYVCEQCDYIDDDKINFERIKKDSHILNNMSLGSNTLFGKSYSINGTSIFTIDKDINSKDYYFSFCNVPKEKKLLTAPDFVGTVYDDYIFVLNEKNESIFYKYSNHYNLYNNCSMNRDDLDKCGLKKCKYKELKEGEIFLMDLEHINDLGYYFLKYKDGYNYCYENGIYNLRYYYDEEEVYKVVSLKESDVYEGD